ncbi:hypothetical protein [Deinococcus peraridilitoris]|uniref:hypothetical protein n=1 Tax=Deinococcus peraridilitoris TaxID=432329 RepID=UPI001FDECD77|nr:hypothetical protein [Deinococcus peraridilitoris]
MSFREVSRALAVLLSTLALAACAPRETAPRQATASTNVTAVSFYPAQVGLSWSYLPEGEALTSPPYTLASQGATLFGDQAALAFRFSGRGAEQTNYRQISDDGQFLLGFTKPGLTVTLTPPLREYPPVNAWRAGLSWSGQTTVRVISDNKVVQEGTVQYRYTVLEKRNVSVPGDTRDVWVINRQISGSAASLFPEANQNFWFAPYAGEMRTPEGLLQISRNYRGS